MNGGSKFVKLVASPCGILSLAAISLLGVFTAAPSFGDDTLPSLQAPSLTGVERIDAAIDRLGSSAYSERDAATRELLQQGARAIPRLEQALPSAKGEVRYRIRSILSTQRRAVDLTVRRAAEQALLRLSAGKDPISASWARAQLGPVGSPLPVAGSLETQPPSGG
jgi:hypothetical protein